MTARPTCALENVKDQHGDAGLRAVATFLHCMGSDGTLAWGEASWSPCDMVMQEAWEMGGAPPPLTEAKLRFMCEQLREWGGIPEDDIRRVYEAEARRLASNAE